MIVDSIDLVFSMIINWGNPRIQAATVSGLNLMQPFGYKHMEGTKDKFTLEIITEEG